MHPGTAVVSSSKKLVGKLVVKYFADRSDLRGRTPMMRIAAVKSVSSGSRQSFSTPGSTSAQGTLDDGPDSMAGATLVFDDHECQLVSTPSVMNLERSTMKDNRYFK